MCMCVYVCVLYSIPNILERCFVCPNCKSSDKIVTFGCLIGVGVFYIFWEIFLTPEHYQDPHSPVSYFLVHILNRIY